MRPRQAALFLKSVGSQSRLSLSTRSSSGRCRDSAYQGIRTFGGGTNALAVKEDATGRVLGDRNEGRWSRWWALPGRPWKKDRSKRALIFVELLELDAIVAHRIELVSEVVLAHLFLDLFHDQGHLVGEADHSHPSSIYRFG